MTRLLVDTSVLIKWFHSDGESELEPSHALRSAHVHGGVDAHVLDLAISEVGNVLVRASRWSATDVADQLDDLQQILGPPLLIRTSADDGHTLAGKWRVTCGNAEAALEGRVTTRRLLARPCVPGQRAS
ncbi:MAG TPA: hypothetical protein VFX52_02400, partial [Nocardioidaceae bacterium]|nr:hypothetical protein [Nocardioidaceae bacterium]